MERKFNKKCSLFDQFLNLGNIPDIQFQQTDKKQNEKKQQQMQPSTQEEDESMDNELFSEENQYNKQIYESKSFQPKVQINKKVDEYSLEKKKPEQFIEKKLLHPDIFQQSFIYLVIGKPDAGKSSLICEMILNEQIYKGFFDFVLYVTPSQMPPNTIQLIKGQNWVETFDFQEIFTLFQKYSDEFGWQYRGRILLVLDDSVGYLKKISNDPLFIKLFMNRRHIIPNLELSIIVTTQKYNLIPKPVRTVSTGIFTFQVNNDEFQAMSKEIVKLSFYLNEDEYQAAIQNDQIYDDIGQIERICNQYFKIKNTFVFFHVHPFKLFNGHFNEIVIF